MDEDTKKAYDTLTKFFTEKNLQYGAAAKAYDMLTEARAYLESHGNKCTDAAFVRYLLEATGDLIDNVNRMFEIWKK